MDRRMLFTTRSHAFLRILLILYLAKPGIVSATANTTDNLANKQMETKAWTTSAKINGNKV